VGIRPVGQIQRPSRRRHAALCQFLAIVPIVHLDFPHERRLLRLYRNLPDFFQGVLEPCVIAVDKRRRFSVGSMTYKNEWKRSWRS